MHSHPGGIVDAALCLLMFRTVGRDDEDYIEALGAVRNIMTEGRKTGAVDFYIGGDINIQMKPGNTGEDLWELDSIDWYGMYGPECRGGGEGVTTCEKMRWLPLLEGFNCTVTIAWAKDYRGEKHTWRAWGFRVRIVVRVRLVWKTVPQEPTSAHQDPDVEDRSQQFHLVHAGWLAKVDMNGSESSTSVLNCFADTPEVSSISEQCPSLGRRRRCRPPGSKLETQDGSAES